MSSRVETRNVQFALDNLDLYGKCLVDHEKNIRLRNRGLKTKNSLNIKLFCDKLRDQFGLSKKTNTSAIWWNFQWLFNHPELTLHLPKWGLTVKKGYPNWLIKKK